jgi:hypothetical protein
VTFVFVGPSLDSSVGRLRQRSNVVLMGDRHPDVLPGYLHGFDVAWIPHRVGDGESGGDPIKLYEYAAAGLPVVSAKIDGWQGWGSLATPFGTPKEAAAIIRTLLAGGPTVRSFEIPVERTWDHIAGRMVELLLARSEASDAVSGPPASRAPS